MARVASQNLFDILGDDDDIEAKIGLSNNTTPTQNETVVVQKHVDRSRASPKESRIRHEYPQFGNADNRSGPRDHNVGRRREDNDNNYNNNNYNNNNYNNNNYQSRSSRGSRSGERGRGRGGRRGGGREFDRHSGSGRYDSEKNDKNESPSWEPNNADWGNSYRTNSTDKIDNNDNSNAFSSNWEPDNNDNAANDNNSWNVTESQEPTDDWGSKDESGGGGGGDSAWDGGKVEASPWETQEEPTYEASGADNKNNENIGEDEATTKPVETEEAVKTLEEYLSEKAQKVLDISLPEVRKPNEGVDDSQWKDAVPLEKKEDGDILFSGKEHSFKIKNKTKKSKNFLEIKPTFDKPGGFQRGGRGGGGRGRGGRGGGGDRNRDDYDNRDNRRGDGGGERSYDNNRDNRDNRRGGSGGGGERSYDYNNNRRGGGGARSYDYNNNNRRGGGGNRSNYVNIDDQGAFPSLGTV